MKPTELRLKPQLQIPNIKLHQIIQYPDLQKRVNSQQFQFSGIHNLISELKKQTIQQLKEQFINNNNSINLYQFMWLISNSVMIKDPTSRNKSIEEMYYQYQIQYQIVKIFQEIDIDNSNSISWEEYIQYITASSLMEINQNTEEQLTALVAQDKDAKQFIYSHKEKTHFRKNTIRKIVEVEKLGLMAIVQKKSDQLSFISINGGTLPKPFTLAGIDHNKVLSIDYSQDDRMFGVLLNTHLVIFVEDAEMPKINVSNQFSGNQIQIMYLKKHKLWALISLDSSIQIFSKQKGRKKDEQQRTIMRFLPHADQLVGIQELHNPASILTYNLGGSIKIWSLTLNQLMIQFRPAKQQDFSQCKSIKGLQVYNNQSVSYIICWMFSPDISVWLPSSSLTKPYVGKLKGHAGIVQQAKFLYNFPIVVSIDNKFSVRAWNVAKMQCIQTWKVEQSINLKMHILKSLPYILFYDRLIDFYKSNKQSNLVDYHHQKLSIVNNQQYLSNNDTKIIKHDTVQLQHINKNKTYEQISYVLSVLYDNHLDCFVILTSQHLSLVAVNSGKLVNRINTVSSNQNFVAMCLKQNRRVFLANNLGQIQCIKNEDCSSLFSIFPFDKNEDNKADRMKNIVLNNESRKQQQSTKLKNTGYTIISLDFNVYNKVLTIIAQSQTNSIIITFDNFQSLDPQKKKQITINQINICSVAYAQKFNLFYIASNQPEVVSIWDYHNFIVLKAIQMQSPIINISVQTDKFNLLSITQKSGIRVFYIQGIDAKNNTRVGQIVLIKKQIFLKNSKPISQAQLSSLKFDGTKMKQRKNQDTFYDVEDRQSMQIQASEQANLYLLIGTTINIVQIEGLLGQLEISNEPSHSNKANIAKQIKKFNINPQMYSSSTLAIDISTMLKPVSSGVKKNIVLLGKVNDLIYFQNDQAVLCFYKPEQTKVCGKLSLPKCQILQWQIFYNLVTKIIDRLIKSQAISKQIYAYKRKQRYDQTKIEYMRLSFILNKYFTSDEMVNLKNYCLNSQSKQKIKRQSQKLVSQAILRDQILIKQRQDVIKKQDSFFDRKNKQKANMIGQQASKLQQIQKKYSKAFSYIKNKRQSLAQENILQDKQGFKGRSYSASAFNSKKQIKKQIGSPAFKIRNNVNLASKIYQESTKQVKNYINKISIINDKIKQLKL